MMVGFVNGDSERPVNESSDERVAQGSTVGSGRGASRFQFPHCQSPTPCSLREFPEEHWALCIVGTQHAVIIVRLQFHLSCPQKVNLDRILERGRDNNMVNSVRKSISDIDDPR